MSSLSVAVDHKPILAERFKTKICRNYVTLGMCPYEQRCMFAHGEADMRTKEMNVADRLTTEEAIKAFQRARYAAKGRETMFAAAEESDIPSIPAVRRPAESPYRHDPYYRWQPFYAETFAFVCTCPGCQGAAMPPPPKYIPDNSRSKVLVP
jgi:hypothetical protein